MDTTPESMPRDQRRGDDVPRGATAANGLAVIDDLMAGGEMLPSQLPFALNQILIALPWTWVGYLCFNHPSWRFTRHHMSYLLAAAAVVSV